MSSPCFDKQLRDLVIVLLLEKNNLLRQENNKLEKTTSFLQDEIQQLKSRLGCVENQMDSIADIVSCSPMFDSGDVMSVADWINSRED